MLAILLMLILTYSWWAAPVLLAFNWVAIRTLKLATVGELSLLFVIDLLVFTPVFVRAHSFFEEAYVPWAAGLMLSPPVPEFSGIAFLLAAACSAGSIAWLAWE